MLVYMEYNNDAYDPFEISIGDSNVLIYGTNIPTKTRKGTAVVAREGAKVTFKPAMCT